jgi:diguanylate cyclase (GGDEF)-like protein
MNVGPQIHSEHAPMDGVTLSAEAIGRLMPMHLVVDRDGMIAGAGLTLAKLFDDASLVGKPFFDLFEVRRPGGIHSVGDLAAHAGARLTLARRGGGGGDLRGLVMPLGRREGLIFNLTFGIGILDGVRLHGLTAADFAPTDLAMELLYLVEAKTAVEGELRELNLRLQGAKRTAEAQALTDTLTGLGNRRALDLTMADEVERANPFGVMNIDLDYFKAVNDTLGHAAGDHVLREVARILGEETRKEDCVARVGGDEFVVVFPGLTDPAVLTLIANRIVERLSEPLIYGNDTCRISASIGISVSTAYDSPTPDMILNDADAALYASKNAGRGQAQLHERVERQYRNA